MNKLSGYIDIELSSGRKQGLKFCNGSTELFARSMGITLLSDLDKALYCPVVDGELQPTIQNWKAQRLYVFAAAQYVCYVTNKPVDFDEWQCAEWIDELGPGIIWQTIDSVRRKAELTEAAASEADSDEAQTLAEFKFNALARLNILPDAFYDLTPAETSALLKGESDRQEFSLWQTRRIATLLRNAHFSKPVTEEQFMPLPGDRLPGSNGKAAPIPPEIFIQILNQTFTRSN